MPNGIVMIRMKAMMPARKYRSAIHQPHRISQIRLRISLITVIAVSYPAAAAFGIARPGRTSSVASRRAVEAATSSTAASNAAALCAAGARNPLIFLTYCRAAARTSASVTCSAYGGRKVLMLRHIAAAYASTLAEAEQRLDAHGEPGGQRGEPADAEQHLLVCHQPGQPHRVHPHVVHARAARARHLLPGGIRRRAEPALSPGLA